MAAWFEAWIDDLFKRPQPIAKAPFWTVLGWVVLIPLLPLGGAAALASGLCLFGLTMLHLASLRRRLRASERARDDLDAARQIWIDLHSQDEITGVMTRRSFLEACEGRLKNRAASQRLAFFAVDLDFLKALNDSFGHKAGDFALATLAGQIRALDREMIVGRIGGDEFGFVVPCADLAAAEQIGDALRTSLASPVFSGGRQLSLSASLGAVMIPDQTVYLTEAMQFADLALYQAKKKGRNQLAMFDAQMLRDLKYRRLIERELRAAILLDELDLHYQPITGVKGELVGLEALLRWESPSRGRISPAQFIPVAESSFLIDQLGEWVLRRACIDARDFGDIRIGVNVSASQLKRDDVVDMVARVLRETGYPADRLVLELTESVAIDATAQIVRRLSALREMGVAISLDDFGTGFSGFDYLRHLPVDGIKIDRSYIAKLGESETDNVLVSALASVASAMRLTVVAEGIETSAQLLLAKAAGCNHFQGFHIARPMPKAELLRLWAKAA